MGFIAMLRGGGMNSSAMPFDNRQMGSGRISPSRQGGVSGNPVQIATKGAERTALNDYGKTLVDRANNVKEE